MASAEKELEEVLMEVGNRILAPPSAVDELLPLLDQAETLLSRVEQSPSQSMSAALSPAMKGLTSQELLGHSDVDVKVAAASCISEITRITAPEAPYDDDLMKEIFQLIVESFEKLDDMQNRSYAKRVSILETVAKVRSCVVMLDLECDALILEMFHHFLRTIRDSHPENVFSSMEMIMTVVLEESEDIPPDLLSCLLACVKKDTKDILQIARRLAEKVIGNCALKLKPCLTDTVQSLGASLDDYSEIVASVCEKDSDQLVHSGLNISGECLADDSKLTLRTLSDEPPKVCVNTGSGKLESIVACPEEVGKASDKSPKSVMGNGTVQTENVDSSVAPTLQSEKIEHSAHSTNHTKSGGAEMDDMDTASDHSAKETIGPEGNSIIQPAEMTEPCHIDNDKIAVESLARSKGSSKEIDGSQSECATEKAAEATALDVNAKFTELQASSEKFPNDNASAVSSAPSEKFTDTGRPKRGRPSGSKGSKKAGINADVPVSPSGAGKSMINECTNNEEMPSSDVSSKKQTEGISDSEPQALRHSAKKRPLGNVDKGGKPSTDSHTKMDLDVTSDSEGKLSRGLGSKPQAGKSSDTETLGKHQASKTKKQKGRVSSENTVAGGPTLKENVSTPMAAVETHKDENPLVETPKMKSQRKRARETEISEAPQVAMKYDESLIGAKIKVWWPDDKQFYPGVIYSYDPDTMRHKVLYADGDEENLILKNEVFTFLKGDEEDKEQDDSNPVAAAEMPRKKLKMSDSSSKKLKGVMRSKGGEPSSAGKGTSAKTESVGKHAVDEAKSIGGRKGGTFKPGNKMADITPTGSKTKEKAGGRASFGSPKADSMSKDELSKKPADAATPKTTAKSKDDLSKPRSKSKDDTPKSGSRMKNNASKSGSTSRDGTPRGGSKAQDDVANSGTKSKDDDAKNSSKSNKGSKSKAGQTPKSGSTIKSGRPAANGTLKGKIGSSKGHRNEVAASDINSNAGTSQDNEEKSGKKRRR